ncbi:MAG: 50S ribosomal protein L11 methyltransferase [Myxococcota bacterium]
MSAAGLSVRLLWEEGTDIDELMEASGVALGGLEIDGFELREGPGWVELLVALGPVSSEDVKSALRSEGLEVQSARDHSYAEVDWATQWRQHFRPLRIGRLDVLPSWCSPPDDAGALLWIDPSMAFGTGLHPTTRLCLERLQFGLPPASVLDLGTGSGILALAALVLGSPSAVAIDNDPEAIRVALENAARNELEARLELSTHEGPDTWPEATHPLVLANILARPLVELAPAITRRVAPGGRLVLAGLLQTQADQVEDAYAACGLRPAGRFHEEEWTALELMA